MGIGQFIDTIEEGQDLTVILQETDHRLVETRQLLVGFVAAWVVRAAAVKHIAAPVAALILRDTLLRLS